MRSSSLAGHALTAGCIASCGLGHVPSALNSLPLSGLSIVATLKLMVGAVKQYYIVCSNTHNGD